MGLVMKAAQAKLAGKRVDGKALSERVRSKLGSSTRMDQADPPCATSRTIFASRSAPSRRSPII